MRPGNTIKVRVLNIVTYLVLTILPFAAADGQEDLAKESQNPIGNIISLPFENNFNFGVGPEDAFVYSLSLKPVYPMTFGKVNLINRFILPVIYQEERFEGEGSEFGLGDLIIQAFFSPAKPGKIIWGEFGPNSKLPESNPWMYMLGRVINRCDPPFKPFSFLYDFRSCGPLRKSLLI